MLTEGCRLTLWASFHRGAPGLRLTPVFALQCKGEGDFRNPSLNSKDFIEGPFIFLGEKETTLRLGLAAIPSGRALRAALR